MAVFTADPLLADLDGRIARLTWTEVLRTGMPRRCPITGETFVRHIREATSTANAFLTHEGKLVHRDGRTPSGEEVGYLLRDYADQRDQDYSPREVASRPEYDFDPNY